MDTAVVSKFKEAVHAFQQGQLEHAATLCRAVVTAAPHAHQAWHLAGVIAASMGDFETAVEKIQQAVSLEPREADYHNNLAIALRRLSRLEQALSAYQQAQRLAPGHASISSNLGDVYAELGQWEAAQKAFEQALSLDPGHREAKFNLANLMRDRGRLKKAIGLYTDLLVQAPEDPDIHWNLGLTQLLSDDYASGFESYNWREKLPGAPPIVGLSGVPRWQGQSLEGRRICLTAEQGFGDSIQMVRFARQLSAKGARVVLRVPGRLVKLLSHALDVAQVFSERDKIEGCDYWAPMMSVPDILGLGFDDITVDEPYLDPPRLNLPDFADVFEAAAGLRVAINWQGDPSFIHDRTRSVPLSELSRILEVEGVSVWSIQKGHGEEAIEALQDDHNMLTLGHRLDLGADGFLETAEVLRRSDLLVTSDTAVAHLAGAIGVDVWLLTSRMPDWRWGTHRTR
ncbi:MAG: tetratricopeptide repeat-containing glycosyltransferase family protein, partial [Myxococcota bacterium]|nr:tetratricopeptide repeat-containing glycosyltransferase family protein [Myxococcota bacterium]